MTLVRTALCPTKNNRVGQSFARGPSLAAAPRGHQNPQWEEGGLALPDIVGDCRLELYVTYGHSDVVRLRLLTLAHI